MNLSVLTSIAGSEEKSEEFLRSKGILKAFKFCPFCGCKSIGRVRRNFFKCYSCRREWSVRKDSILEDLKVPSPKEWLLKFLNFLNKQAGGPHDDPHFLQTSP